MLVPAWKPWPSTAFSAGPLTCVHDLERQLDDMEMRAQRAIAFQMTRHRDRLAALAARLESLSPLGVLARGYSLTQRTATGQVVTDAAALAVGDEITSRYAHGQSVSRVTEIRGAP